MNLPRITYPESLAWKEAFPIRREQEARMGRRGFLSCLAATSIVAMPAMALLTAASKREKASEPTWTPLMDTETVPVKGHKLFQDPRNHTPYILARLEQDTFVAYDQRCTHLSCPVHFRAETSQFVCPCHEGYFNAADGAVMAGPPQKPLNRLPIQIRDGKIFVHYL